MRRTILSASGGAAALFALALGGCGGSGSTAGSTGGGSVTGLAVADKVSVVDAQQTTSGAGKLLSKLMGVSVGGSDSAYNTDKTFTYVHDRSTESFKTVNEILCMIGQTKYADMVNQGVYKAQINTKLCRGNDSADNASASQQAGSSATDAPEYETWIVESTRPDNSSAQTVKVWFHEKSQGQSEPAKFINAKIVITEAATDANPYGIFSMNFVAYAEGTSNVLFKGTLKSEKDAQTGKVLLKFANEESNGKFKQAASLEKNPSGSGGGTAYEYTNFNQVEEGTINFAYNSTLFHRIDDQNNEACLDRTAFETSAWRYGMYNATDGSRINVSSGFPINTRQDGTGANGWVGFWGLWVPDGVTINNGDTVYKQTFGPSGGTSTAYKVQKVNGKLKKHTKSTLTLADIKNIPMEGGIPDPANQSPSNTMYRVTWDGTDLAIRAQAVMGQNGPPAWSDYYVPITSSTHLPFGELSFYSQALGGQVRIMLEGCTFTPPAGQVPGYTTCNTPGASTQVAFYKEDIVYPGDSVPASLVCYDTCPNATSGIVSGSSSQTASSYTFENMVLKDGNGAAQVQTSAGGQSWGFNSGPLFDSAKNNATDLGCPWDQTHTQICGWRAWSALNEFYTWETGVNNWNQLTLLLDGSNAPLKFEQPLRVEYTHVQTAAGKPDSKYNGVKFFLDYNGFGELQGIPGKCVDMSGQSAQCGPNTRWVPEFTIAEGSSASYTKEGTTYNAVIKPLEVEQRMVKYQDSTPCSGLPLSTYTLPQISQWVDPALGAEPTVTAAPAVIGGVVQ